MAHYFDSQQIKPSLKRDLVANIGEGKELPIKKKGLLYRAVKLRVYPDRSCANAARDLGASLTALTHYASIYDKNTMVILRSFKKDLNSDSVQQKEMFAVPHAWFWRSNVTFDSDKHGFLISSVYIRTGADRANDNPFEFYAVDFQEAVSKRDLKTAGTGFDFSEMYYNSPVRPLVAISIDWKHEHNFTTRISPFYGDITIDVRRGVRQGDTVSPKLFTATPEDVMRRLEWDYMGVRVDGRLLHHLRFADDIVLITPSISQAERMLADFDDACGKIGREVNMMNDLAPELGRRKRAVRGAYRSIEDVVKKTKNTRLPAHLFNTTQTTEIDIFSDILEGYSLKKYWLPARKRASHKLGLSLVDEASSGDLVISTISSAKRRWFNGSPSMRTPKVLQSQLRITDSKHAENKFGEAGNP
ncbi:hypothetical protein ANCCEY_13280 [Ancylostoma ceylanicum]|uniref:Reverse transcriptase domain-containing protein n=1 Tax=Ancylostoma ceylanicum TaxID=53326 RepID=A0A0D6LCQ7_9BILA|nr:hypothetical protein ANCCEY_13280 [Ancylostoma ceylanicum]